MWLSKSTNRRFGLDFLPKLQKSAKILILWTTYRRGAATGRGETFVHVSGADRLSETGHLR